VQTKWDVTRFADRVKNTRVHEDRVAQADLTLPLFFPQANFGELETPTTILDMHGKIMVWSLSGVLHPKRLVNNSMYFCLKMFLKYFNSRTITELYVDLKNV
jgi:hypothetical protein